jgi:DNA replication and repair protein RecF
MINRLLPLAQQFYNDISQTNEEVKLVYRSQLQEDNMLNLLRNSDEKDFFTQRTNVGIHKDDILFLIDQFPLKQHASQGQKKSFLFAIKLAEYTLLKDILHRKPLLLLDDIFEKLDLNRSHYLIDLITKLDTQIFITDTHLDRLKEAFKSSLGAIQFEKID